jgi:hypothetical protein
VFAVNSLPTLTGVGVTAEAGGATTIVLNAVISLKVVSDAELVSLAGFLVVCDAVFFILRSLGFLRDDCPHAVQCE